MGTGLKVRVRVRAGIRVRNRARVRVRVPHCAMNTQMPALPQIIYLLVMQL